MAALDKFFNELPLDWGKIKDVDNIINSQGDFKEIFDIEVILKSIQRLLLTPKGTYPHDPEFGVGIQRYLFEPATIETLDDIKKSIQTAIDKYENRGNITFDVEFFENRTGFRINFEINYRGLVKNSKIDIDQSLLKENVRG